MTVGLGSAILVLLCTALGCGVALVAEHERADFSKLRPARQSPSPEDEPLLRDEYEYELERYDVELPEEEVASVAGEVEYGWPTPSS